MKSVGILFPGQGAQAIGMGRWLRDTYPAASKLFDQASEILGYDLAVLCEQGPESRLNETVYSQPALFVVGMAAATVMREQYPERVAAVKAAAGLSLGEYTAVCFAGGLDFADGVRLVQRRGQAMQAAADAVNSGMASIIGLDLEEVESVCQECREEGEVLQPANLLCPGNIAVSGHSSAIERLAPAAEAAGAVSSTPERCGSFSHFVDAIGRGFERGTGRDSIQDIKYPSTVTWTQVLIRMRLKFETF